MKVSEKITMRIGDGGGTGLGGGSCKHHPHKVRGIFDRFLLFVHAGLSLVLKPFSLDSFIDDKMDNSLRDASV